MSSATVEKMMAAMKTRWFTGKKTINASTTLFDGKPMSPKFDEKIQMNALTLKTNK